MIAARRVDDAYALTESPDTPDLPPQQRYETWVGEPEVPRDRIHDPIEYHELEHMGNGAIGSVSRVLDLHSGRIMAVKIISGEGGNEKVFKERGKLEVQLLACYRYVSLIY